MATTDGSLETTPLPLTYIRVFAVPKSTAKSLENILYIKFIDIITIPHTSIIETIHYI